MAEGFGSSMYLWQRVKEMCGHLLRRDPVTPGDANKAVVLGECTLQPAIVVRRSHSGVVQCFTW
jgi:hypothetical protein